MASAILLRGPWLRFLSLLNCRFNASFPPTCCRRFSSIFPRSFNFTTAFARVVSFSLPISRERFSISLRIPSASLSPRFSSDLRFAAIFLRSDSTDCLTCCVVSCGSRELVLLVASRLPTKIARQNANSMGIKGSQARWVTCKRNLWPISMRLAARIASFITAWPASVSCSTADNNRLLATRSRRLYRWSISMAVSSVLCREKKVHPSAVTTPVIPAPASQPAAQDVGSGAITKIFGSAIAPVATRKLKNRHPINRWTNCSQTNRRRA